MKFTTWRKTLSKNGLLYLIVDSLELKKANLDIFSFADKSAAGGVDFFQFRAKDLCDREVLNTAKRLAKIIQRRKKVFIVNDRVDIAYLSKADGLHLGSSDISVAAARKILGKRFVIGKTCHSFQELLRIKKEDINYLSLGPVFATKTKPQLKPLSLKELKIMIRISDKPIFAVGGIDIGNLFYLLANGIRNIAICRGLILSGNLKKTIRQYKQCLQRAS